MKKIIYVITVLLLFTTFVYAIEYADVKSEAFGWDLIEVNDGFVVYEKPICQRWENVTIKDTKDALSLLDSKSITLSEIYSGVRCAEWKTLSYVQEEKVQFEYSCITSFTDYKCDYISKDDICYVDEKEKECLLGDWEAVIDDTKIKVVSSIK